MQARPKPNPRSLTLLTAFWAILQLTGLTRPGLLDDVDSVYLEIAREMLHRHDYVTPAIDGIRFFDKPPLMYWLAAASMRLFGETDWAARIPLTLAVLALLLALYFLALRLYAHTEDPDRPAFYSALALATAIGPYLYTRFYIPDILICLWMTLAVHAFLLAVERTRVPQVRRSLTATTLGGPEPPKHPQTAASQPIPSPPAHSLANSTLLPSLAFALTLALNLLTKGLIGLIFPIAFVLLYLAFTRNLRLLARFHPVASTLVFAAIALPWHILAALRNPAIPMPPGLGLPQKAGWAWFYLYNEHLARALGRRIPHDYGNTPIWLFWLLAALWIFPWTTFLPAAVAQLPAQLRKHSPGHEAALTVTLWSLVVLVFFTVSGRQEYYSLPALPALALMAGALLAQADLRVPQVRRSLTATTLGGPQPFPPPEHSHPESPSNPTHSTLLAHRWFLLPLASLLALLCTWLSVTAPHPTPGADLATVLTSNPADYNVSLGHIFDLTGRAMAFFRLPLLVTAAGMLILGPASYLLRATRRLYAANLTLAAGMTIVLLAAHSALITFNPILGSKPLAEAILTAQSLESPAEQAATRAQKPQSDLILLDGELTSGSTLLFYTRQPVHLVDGRVNGPWFGSFWPDAPKIFETGQSLHTLWSTPRRLFLLTYHPAARTRDLTPYGPVYTLAHSGGKTILTNHPPATP